MCPRPAAIFPLLAGVSLLALLPSCSRKWEMMPTPIVHQQNGERSFRRLKSEDDRSDLRVFYATNRIPEGDGQKPLYGNGVSQDMRVGVNTIRFGERPITLQTLIRASTQDDREEEIPMDLDKVSEQAVITKEVTGSSSIIRRRAPSRSAQLTTRPSASRRGVPGTSSTHASS